MDGMDSMDGVHLGTSGWTYDHWAGVFYPDGLAKAHWRDYYVEHFDTVELNASFYRWPGLKPFEGWSRSLPDGFRMSVKASRWLSHGRRLRDPEGAWASRLTQALHALRRRAGVVLVQLPDDLERDDDRLATFLDELPGDVPVAMELRHPSWDHDEVATILERHGAAFVVTHGTGLHTVLRTTAPFVYCRWHGPTDQPRYAGGYSPAELEQWAGRVVEWRRQGLEVWGYFDNDGGGHAPADALALRRLLDWRAQSTRRGSPGRSGRVHSW